MNIYIARASFILEECWKINPLTNEDGSKNYDLAIKYADFTANQVIDNASSASTKLHWGYVKKEFPRLVERSIELNQSRGSAE